MNKSLRNLSNNLPEDWEERLLAAVRPEVASLYKAAKTGGCLEEILRAMREQSRIGHSCESGVSVEVWWKEAILGEMVWLMWAKTLKGGVTIWWLSSRQAAGYACSHFPKRIPRVVRYLLEVTGTAYRWRHLKWGNAKLPQHGVEGGATVRGVEKNIVRLWGNFCS